MIFRFSPFSLPPSNSIVFMSTSTQPPPEAAAAAVDTNWRDPDWKLSSFCSQKHDAWMAQLESNQGTVARLHQLLVTGTPEQFMDYVASMNYEQTKVFRGFTSGPSPLVSSGYLASLVRHFVRYRTTAEHATEFALIFEEKLGVGRSSILKEAASYTARPHLLFAVFALGWASVADGWETDFYSAEHRTVLRGEGPLVFRLIIQRNDSLLRQLCVTGHRDALLGGVLTLHGHVKEGPVEVTYTPQQFAETFLWGDSFLRAVGVAPVHEDKKAPSRKRSGASVARRVAKQAKSS